MVEQKIEEIIDRESDIDPYGSTSRTEFFAVIAEYFFERPQLLQKKHPKLYAWLCDMFSPKTPS
jgi:Mlc titration factor MtfA (ptsG expression regulator)